jgi:hypothetical protein
MVPDSAARACVASVAMAAPMTPKPGMGVRRDKAALSSGCKSRPASAPAGSNRSSSVRDEDGNILIYSAGYC